jgi:hypothetical protein
MGFDFPSTPSVGDTFTDPVSTATFKWNGYGWDGGAGGGAGAILVGPTPPASAPDNALWWESDTGFLFFRYNDGNSTQWVQVNAQTQPDLSSVVRKSGDTMTGLLLLSGDPAQPLGAVTKQYSDTKLPLLGVTDGSNALAGQIGEAISSNVASPGITLVNGTPSNVTNITITPGDWDVSGEVWLQNGAGLSTANVGGFSTTSITFAASSVAMARAQLMMSQSANALNVMPLRPARVNVTASTIYYLIAQANFPSGTCTAWGNIIARRAR